MMRLDTLLAAILRMRALPPWTCARTKCICLLM